MSWFDAVFFGDPCWVSDEGKFRIMASENGGYELFRDRGFSTEHWSGFDTPEAAQHKALSEFNRTP